MLLAPVEEGFDQAEHEFRAHRGRPIHQLVVLFERFVLVGPEVVLLAVELEIPEATILPKKGLGKCGMGAEPSRKRILDGPEGPRSPASVAAGRGIFSDRSEKTRLSEGCRFDVSPYAA